MFLYTLKKKSSENYFRLVFFPFQDHHGIQCHIRSAEDELNDPERMDLKHFVTEDCGLLGSSSDDTIDTVADVLASSRIHIECQQQQQQCHPDFPGLFLTAGLLSHSCLPNTRLMFERLDEKGEPGGGGELANGAESSASFGGPSLFRLTAFSSVKICRGERLTRCAVRPEGALVRKATRQRRRELRKALIECCCPR